MISHHDIRSVLTNLDIDADNLALLNRYVDGQAALDERSDPVRRANAAERRSDEAIARCGTLTNDLTLAQEVIVEISDDLHASKEAVIKMRGKIKSLEDQVATMMEIITELSA